MSVQVNYFDEEKAKKELKSCPKIVQDYIRLIEESKMHWQDIAKKAMGALRKSTTEVEKITKRIEEITEEIQKDKNN